MDRDEQFAELPGVTGEEESQASIAGGGFAWSRERAARYGAVCRSTFRGQDVVLLTGEEGIRAFYNPMFVERGETKSAADLAFLSDGRTKVVPTLDDEAFGARKTALLHAVTPQALARYTPIVDRVLRDELRGWAGREFDLRAELKRISFLALSTVITGAPGTPAQAADYAEASLGFNGIEPESHLAARDRLIAWYHEVVSAMRGKSADEASSCMIGILAHETALSDDEICAEVQHLFIGSGGVPLAGCSALAFLADHPAIAERVRSEVSSLPVEPSHADLVSASFLRTFSEEVLRWAPIINAQIGRARRSFVVDGRTIPEGTLVLGGFYATNHDGKLYPEPDRFDPERPAAGADGAVCPFSKSAPFTYLPFGGGDRRSGHRCLGEELVYLTLELLLARTLPAFTLTLVDPDAIRRLPAAHLAPEVRVRVA